MRNTDYRLLPPSNTTSASFELNSCAQLVHAGPLSDFGTDAPGPRGVCCTEREGSGVGLHALQTGVYTLPQAGRSSLPAVRGKQSCKGAMFHFHVGFSMARSW